MITRPEISLQFYRRYSRHNLWTSATSAKQYRQIDPGEYRSLKMREIRSFHTQYIFIDSPGTIILTRRRGMVFCVSCRAAESRGIYNAREAFNIVEFRDPSVILSFGRQNRVGIVDLSRYSGEINSDATGKRGALSFETVKERMLHSHGG